MKVLITGIDGFTGRHLEKHLISAGFDIYGTIINSQASQKHLKCDICSIEEVQRALDVVQPDYIIHLAAISFVGEQNRSLIYDTNVIGTQNILDAALSLKKKPKKIILASSATVYGIQTKEVLDESMCPCPVSHYGISKLAMEHMAAAYFGKLDILITRPFNYTGIGQAEHFLIPKIVSHYRDNKRRIELGNLHVEREFNPIDWVVDIYRRLLDASSSGVVINLCSGKTSSLLQVIALMNELAGYEIEVVVNPTFVRANEIAVLKGSTKQLCSILQLDALPEFDLKTLLSTMYAQ